MHACMHGYMHIYSCMSIYVYEFSSLVLPPQAHTEDVREVDHHKFSVASDSQRTRDNCGFVLKTIPAEHWVQLK